MTPTADKADGRTRIARRNARNILDAVERLLAGGGALNMAALAAEAGVSRPTLYAHYKTVGAAVEAAVERSVLASMAAFAAAKPEDGPAEEALERMLAASWSELGTYRPLARGAMEHLPPGAAHRSHEAMMAPLTALIGRGRRDGVFRTDVPADWLLSMYFALVHGALDHSVSTGLAAEDAFALLVRTARDLYAPRADRSGTCAA
jgi:AcrR family transcriptional regulator